jgi:hypothetical protein
MPVDGLDMVVLDTGVHADDERFWLAGVGSLGSD